MDYKSKKKKILISCDYNIVGGVEVELKQLLDRLDYAKYDITLYVRDPNHIPYMPPEQVRIKTNLVQKKNSICQIVYHILCRLFSNDFDKNSYFATMCYQSDPEKYDCAVCYKHISPFKLYP